jgi:hypothetical protein
MNLNWVNIWFHLGNSFCKEAAGHKYMKVDRYENRCLLGLQGVLEFVPHPVGYQGGS